MRLSPVSRSIVVGRDRRVGLKLRRAGACDLLIAGRGLIRLQGRSFVLAAVRTGRRAQLPAGQDRTVALRLTADGYRTLRRRDDILHPVPVPCHPPERRRGRLAADGEGRGPPPKPLTPTARSCVPAARRI